MARPFIPASDALFDVWMYNFAAKVAAAPAVYGLSPLDGAQAFAAFDAWNAAFLLAQAPGTRTRVAVAAKDQQRAAATQVARRLAALIRVNATVSNELKINLGLRIRGTAMARAGAPVTQPTLTVQRIAMGTHYLAVADMVHTTSRGKPQGAAALLVLRTISDAGTRERDGAAFLTLATRGRFRSEFTRADSGKTATYFACWTNSKGQLGPWSMPSSMKIAA